MNKSFSKFFAELVEIDLSDVQAETQLKELSMWDSLGIISFIAFANTEFSVNVTGDQVAECKTIGDLAAFLD